MLEFAGSAMLAQKNKKDLFSQKVSCWVFCVLILAGVRSTAAG
jgi:hypothetical protein